MSAALPAMPTPLVEPPCWYSVLRVAPDATADELRQAWRQAALRAHPDKVAGDIASGSSTATSTNCSAHFLLVQQAWEVLQDPGRRAAYDRQRALHAARQQVAINETVEWEEMEPELAEGQPCHAWPCRCGGAFLLLDEDAQAADGATAAEGTSPPELIVPCSTCSLHIRALLPPGGTFAQ